MFATHSAAQTNLLENGGFESWTDNVPDSWKSTSTASSGTLNQSTDAHNGSYSVNVKTANTKNSRLAYKETTLKAGTYKMAFYAKACNENETASVAVGYTPVTDGKTGTYVYEKAGSTINYREVSNNWLLIEWEFTLTESTQLCLLAMNHGTSSAPGHDVLIDDFTLTTEDGGIDDTYTPPTPTLEEAANLADVKTKAVNAEYLISLNNAVVTYVNGSNAYIEDGTAGMLIYKSGHGLTAGQRINGKIKGKLELFNNLYELTSPDVSEATITDGAEIPVTTITVAELQNNFAKYESMRVKVEGVTAVSAFESRYASISQDGNEVTLYQRDSNAAFTFAANDRLDVIGYPGLYKDARRLNVWEVSDVTILGEEPPVPPVEELEEVESLAEAKNRLEGKYIINLENAVVTYVNGKNAYIEDGETGILIYLEEQTLEVGQAISGKVVAEISNYYGLYELDSFDTTDATITEAEEIPLTAVTIEELLANPAKYESRRVKVTNVTAESAFINREANIKQDESVLGLYQKDTDVVFSFGEGDILDVIGYLGTFREKLQLNVWEESDVTVHATDGISQVALENGHAKAYTLDGRRVEKLTKGIYIVNGKKVLVK